MPSYFYAYFLLAFSTLQHGQCRVLLLDSKIVLNLELIGSRLCPSSAKTTRLPRRESLLIHMLLVQRCQPRHMLRTSDTSLMAHPWTLQATTLYTEVCHGGVWISMVPNAGVAHLFLIWQENKRIMLRSLIKTYYKMNEQACILGEFLDKACSLLQRLATLRQRCGNGGLLLHPPNRRSVAWVSKPGRWKLLNNVHCHPFIWPWIDHHRQPIVTYYKYNQFYPKFQSLAWHECDSNLNWSEHGFNLAYCHSVQVRGPYYSQVNLQLSNLEDWKRQSLKSILLVDLCKVLKGCVQHQDLHVKSSEKERLSAWLGILVHWMITVHSSLFLSMFELNWAVLLSSWVILRCFSIQLNTTVSLGFIAHCLTFESVYK